jgi:hypothetical protein
MKKIGYFLSVLAVASSFAACAPKKVAQQPAEGQKAVINSKTVPSGPYEKLINSTAESPAYVLVNKPQVKLDKFAKDKDGFISIFDGKTFNGWRGYLKDVVPGKWIIEDGAIKFNASGVGEAKKTDGGDLIFAHKFKNFELTFEWKVAKGSNSGVLYLLQEIKGEPIYISSPEYQILDNDNHPDAKAGKNGNRKSASLYDMIPANPQNAKGFGEWNTGSIQVLKGIVIHKQNGEKVLEYRLWTPEWKELIVNSKFKPGGSFPLAYALLNNLGGPDHEGYIGLQDHGNDVWYRNIKIKILK